MWLVCLATGAQLVAGVPVAGHDLYDQAKQVTDGLLDRERFEAQVVSDTSSDQAAGSMLNALRGKDVILAFVESYGRSAVEDPELSPRIRSTLEQGAVRLRQAGFRLAQRLAHLADLHRRELAGPLRPSNPDCGSTTSSATTSVSPVTA